MLYFKRCETAVNSAALALAVFGALGLLFATLITCTSILLRLTRRALDALLVDFIDASHWSGIQAILGEEELVQYAVALAMFAALPWVMLNKGHIRIDLFSPLYSHRLNQLLDVIADVTLTLIAYLIMTRQWYLIVKKTRGNQDSLWQLLFSGDTAQLIDRLRLSQETQILALPLWPFHIMAQVSVTVFFFIGLFCILRGLRTLWITRAAAPTGKQRAPIKRSD